MDEVLELVLDMPADFKPDTNRRYSNTNYLLIGAILDKVLGYSHQRYIKEKILSPLGLSRTYGSLRQVDSKDVVSGYHRPYEVDFKDVDFTNPGGSYIATAQDTGVFLRALNDGSLLNPDEQAIYSSIYEFGHKGWVLGYQSIARYHEDVDAVVVQFVNTTGKDTELTAMVVYNRIVRILSKK
jgi:CubicO group peptidase (beta-lactamase class C family)